MLSDYISMAIDGRGADQLVSAGRGQGVIVDKLPIVSQSSV